MDYKINCYITIQFFSVTMDLKELNQQKKHTKNSRHPWELARLEIIYKKIKQHLDFNKPSIFIDIGCGDTFVAEQLMKKIPNSTFYCIDNAFTNEQLASYTKKYDNLRIKVFKSIDEAINQLDSEISFILVLDVLEHIKMDIEFLSQIVKLQNLNKESRILITVPAFQSLFTNHDIILGHYRRYTNTTLEKTISKVGLKAIEKGYFFSSLVFLRFIQKMYDYIFKPSANTTAIAIWSKGPFITNLYKNILLLDFTITSFLEKINIKIIGLSNYMICKK